MEKLILDYSKWHCGDNDRVNGLGKGKVEPFNHRSLGRKPDIGLLFEMESDSYTAGYIVDWDNSLFVGDRPEDEECAERAGISFRHIDHFLTQPHTFEIPE